MRPELIRAIVEILPEGVRTLGAVGVDADEVAYAYADEKGRGKELDVLTQQDFSIDDIFAEADFVVVVGSDDLVLNRRRPWLLLTEDKPVVRASHPMDHFYSLPAEYGANGRTDRWAERSELLILSREADATTVTRAEQVVQSYNELVLAERGTGQKTAAVEKVEDGPSDVSMRQLQTLGHRAVVLSQEVISLSTEIDETQKKLQGLNVRLLAVKSALADKEAEFRRAWLEKSETGGSLWTAPTSPGGTLKADPKVTTAQVREAMVAAEEEADRAGFKTCGPELGATSNVNRATTVRKRDKTEKFFQAIRENPYITDDDLCRAVYGELSLEARRRLYQITYQAQTMKKTVVRQADGKWTIV